MPKVPLGGYTSSLKNFDSDMMYSYMSPFNKSEPPAFPLGTAGKFLTTNNVKRHSFNTQNKDILILLCPSNRSVSNAIMWEWNSTTGSFDYIDSSILNLSTTWKFSETNTEKPVVSGAVRCACKLMNTNSSDKTKGVVRILSSSNPLDLVFTGTDSLSLNAASSNALLESIKDNVRTRTYPASTFNSSDIGDKQIIGGVSSLIGYQEWGIDFPTQTTSLGGLASTFINSQKRDFHMNNILILLEATGADAGDNQNYELIYCTQNKMRFPLNSLLNTLEKHPFTTDKAGKTLEHVGEGEKGLTSVTSSSSQTTRTVPTARPVRRVEKTAAQVIAEAYKKIRDRNKYKGAKADAKKYQKYAIKPKKKAIV